jgi:CheY-like chemotaxis protein
MSDTATKSSEYDDLLNFLYQAPIALLQIAANGDVKMITPRAAALLMPLSEGFLDNLFQSMDGYEATRRIKQLPGFRELPVIALTANSMSEERFRDLTTEMVDHLTKPIHISQLRRTLLRWIIPSPAGDTAPRVPDTTTVAEGGIPLWRVLCRLHCIVSEGTVRCYCRCSGVLRRARVGWSPRSERP